MYNRKKKSKKGKKKENKETSLVWVLNMPKHLEQISTHVLGPFFFYIKGDDLLSTPNVFCFKKK